MLERRPNFTNWCLVYIEYQDVLFPLFTNTIPKELNGYEYVSNLLKTLYREVEV